jgi:hypothetical protein
VHAIRVATSLTLWEKLRYLLVDREIIFYIFNISQMDMASRRFIGSTRETEGVYDSIIQKEV